MVTHLSKSMGSWPQLVANYLGLKAPDGQDSTKAGKAKGLSQEEGPKGSIKSRKVAILAADGVNSAELVRMEDRLKQKGATAETDCSALGHATGHVRRSAADR